MRHRIKGKRLGSSWAHTKAMKKSLTRSIFLNDRIKTTEVRAKEVRSDVDRIVTWAKRGDLHSRRLAVSALGNDSALAAEVFEKVSQGMFRDRMGGYTRILKLGPRMGDGAQMVIMELVNETVVPKAKRREAEAETAPRRRATRRRQRQDTEMPAAESAAEESTTEKLAPVEDASEENATAEHPSEDGAELENPIEENASGENADAEGLSGENAPKES